MTITADQATVGFGRRMRKEDARFLRGKGNYVDDFVLPGMLHGAVLRSPYAHARLVSIDTSAAEAHPGVRAVITGALLETLKLAWMPSLSYDVVAVLATDKVRFHGQEVAFVVADDRYAARDALELIDVDYEPLPPVIDARRALDPDAPTTTSSTGRPATVRRLTPCSLVQRWSWPRTSFTPACIPPHWRRVARSPTWTK